MGDTHEADPPGRPPGVVRGPRRPGRPGGARVRGHPPVPAAVPAGCRAGPAAGLPAGGAGPARFGRSDPQPGRALEDWPADAAALMDGIGVDGFAVARRLRRRSVRGGLRGAARRPGQSGRPGRAGRAAGRARARVRAAGRLGRPAGPWRDDRPAGPRRSGPAARVLRPGPVRHRPGAGRRRGPGRGGPGAGKPAGGVPAGRRRVPSRTTPSTPATGSTCCRG